MTEIEPANLVYKDNVLTNWVFYQGRVPFKHFYNPFQNSFGSKGQMQATRISSP